MFAQLFGKELRYRAWLPIIGFALIVLGSKFALIATYANATPFWDQWDAEADRLFRPWLEGTWQWSSLFAPHSEHRILTTRLLALSLFAANASLWDPIIEMQVNALIHVAGLSLLLHIVSQTLNHKAQFSLLCFCAVVFSIPFGWENTLAGFQSQFYFLVLFGSAYFLALLHHETYTLKWWCGLACGLLTYFSLAAGAFTFFAGTAILALKGYCYRREQKFPFSAIALNASIAIGAVLLTPIVPQHAHLRAQSLSQFASALTTLFAWPSSNVLLGLITIQLPLIALVIKSMRNLKSCQLGHWFVIAMCMCLFGQIISLAFGRAAVGTASRYQDLFTIGLALNFACLGILKASVKPSLDNVILAAWVIWIGTVAFSVLSMRSQIEEQLQQKFMTGQAQEINVRAYVVTGDFSHLDHKPHLDIPYPAAERLRQLLENPLIRRTLPSNINPQNADVPPSSIKRLLSFLMTLHQSMIAIGIAILILCHLGLHLRTDHEQRSQADQNRQS